MNIIKLAPMKCGNMSIVRYFDMCDINLPRFRHKLPHEIVKEIGEEKFDEAFKFLFVRNPYARLVSYFHYQIKQGRKKGCKEDNNFIYADNGAIIPLHFDEYVKYIYNKTLSGYSLMSNYICYKNRVIIDFVGRLENIERDIVTLLRLLEIPTHNLPALPRINTTTHMPYSAYYNKESKELIYDKFRADFEVFGYNRKII